MTILNITNLTDTPEQDIRRKYLDAFTELEDELKVSIDDREKHNFIDTQIDYLEEHMENSLGSELLSIIDNYLVNLDYYSEVKEWYQNK